MAQPNLTQNPGPGQAKSTKYGPPKSPKIGRGNCPHHRPRKRRNRACKECGYYTLEQAQNGGIVSGKVRRDRNTRRDRQIQGCKGDLPAPATAKKFGLSVRQIFRIWTRPRIPNPCNRSAVSGVASGANGNHDTNIYTSSTQRTYGTGKADVLALARSAATGR